MQYRFFQFLPVVGWGREVEERVRIETDFAGCGDVLRQ
jgi:hypothetical protein